MDTQSRPGSRRDRMLERTGFDVVVVGSGAAGMNAAIHAAQAGATVGLLDKAAIGRSGASVQANVSASAARAGRWESHAEDIVRVGRGLAQPRLAARLARDALERFEEWASWGVPFQRLPDGTFRRQLSLGHAEPRAVSPGYGMGEKVCRALRKRVMGLPSITCLSHTPALDVAVGADGAVAGLLAWDFRDGGFRWLDTAAIVLATGGAQELYARSTTSPHLTGDGHAMAYTAGATLVDMEFVLSVPVCLVHPRPIGISRTVMEPVRKIAGRLLDRDGQSFTRAFGASEADRAPWEVLSRAIALARRAGRGTDSGCVHFVADDAELAEINEVFPTIVGKFARCGIDLRNGVEVAPMAHFFPGGVLVDEQAETSVPGMFAAGEAAGGIHGATRLGGDALTAAAVFGAVAGQSAARRAARQPRPRLAERIARSRLDEALDTHDAAAAPPAQARADVQRIMSEHCGELRSADGLRRAARELAAVPRRYRIGPADPRLDYMRRDALEARSMSVVGARVVEAALARPQSLGAHFRVDDQPDGREVSYVAR